MPAGHADHLHGGKKQRRETTAVYCPGINADFCVRAVGFVKNGMAENNRFAEVVVAAQKLFPGPQAPLRSLLAEMSVGLQAGVHIDGIGIFPKQRQGVEKGEMLAGYFRHGPGRRGKRIKAVTGQSICSAGVQVDTGIPSAQILKQHELVVAHERDDARMDGPQIENGLYNLFGLRAAIDIITEKNDRFGPMLYLSQQLHQRDVTTMDVADGAGQLISDARRLLDGEKII